MSPVLKQIPGSFGGLDEAAMHEQFEKLVGGPSRAFRLLEIWKRAKGSAPTWGMLRRTREEVFEMRALREGFTRREIQAFYEVP